jgi:hypothetical protein
VWRTSAGLVKIMLSFAKLFLIIGPTFFLIDLGFWIVEFGFKVFCQFSKDPGPEGPALVHPGGVIWVITFTAVFRCQVSAQPPAQKNDGQSNRKRNYE